MPSRRALVLIALVGGLVLAVGVAAGYVVLRHRPGDVSHPEVRFLPGAPKTPRQRPTERFDWPLFGYSKEHTRVYRTSPRSSGRWRSIWRYGASALLEFPPVIHQGALFQLADDGILVSVERQTGRLRWKRRLGALAASSPAAGAGRVYVTLLKRDPHSNGGRIVALDARSGRVRWSRDLPARSESSPLLWGGALFFGTESGVLYRLDADSGKIVWRYHASGAIKGSPSLVDGTLYFGDYGGHVQAVRARTGRRVWDNGASSGAIGGGTFYATAAVAYGRVYIGGTDGREYSFSTRDGKLAWARQTRGYVYSSAAVQDVPGLGPTVFFGSYAGTFYALDARTGRIRWSYRAGGRLSGAATIIGASVFFADLGQRVTIGLSTKNGHVDFRRSPGAFDPVISDGIHLFLTGTKSLEALVPDRAPASRPAQRRPAVAPTMFTFPLRCVRGGTCRLHGWWAIGRGAAR